MATAPRLTGRSEPRSRTISYYLKDGYTQDDNHKVALVIKDAQGKQLKQIVGPGTPGLPRLQWDLRQTSSGSTSKESAGGRGGGRRPAGPLVEPGKYTITMIKIVDDKETVLGQPQTLQVKPL